MRTMITLAVAVAVVSGALAASGGEISPPRRAAFSSKPVAKKAGEGVTVSFAVSAKTDVEVTVLDSKGKVVRHLAAGVLGGETPPPAPLVAGLSQSLAWDGKDDRGEKAKAGPFSVRVRAGMGVKLENLVGGDPYASYSREMGQGDHSGWRLAGLEAKSDGTVYVLSNMNYSGQPAIRRFDAAGNYLKTVFPPPANLPAEKVKGWGIVQHDGGYGYQYSDLGSVALSKTFISGWRAPIPFLIPSPDKDSLLLCEGGSFKLMKVNTDGSVAANPYLEGPLVREPSLFEKTDKGKLVGITRGQLHVTLAPDGKHYYISALHAGKFVTWRRKHAGAVKTGFWRDGQVFKVDVASRKAAAFFALDGGKVIEDMGDREKSGIADARYGGYSALQGAVADAEGRVFAGDRQNRRILVLDESGKIIREIPCDYPDMIAVNPKSKAIYVTTRKGHYHGAGNLTLLKFNDWSKDTKPSATVPLCGVSHFSQRTHLTVAESKNGIYLWVAYTALPVRVYRDKGPGLELVKDFYEAGPQRTLGIEHMVADQSNGDVYVMDCCAHIARVRDWKNPRFERCVMADGQPFRALSLGVDTRKRLFYVHTHMSAVRRYAMEGDAFKPSPAGSGGVEVTGPMCNDWRIGLGQGDRGLAIAPDGSLATLGTLQKGGAAYSGPLNFFRADPARAPWKPVPFPDIGKGSKSAGVRFDPQGNLYAGKCDGPPKNPPKGFENNRDFLNSTGRIYKFAPTGKPGDLFPTAPGKPARIYEVNYGSISPRFSRTPRFGVDGWGRIYYPTTLLPRVSVIDNEGNAIVSFGTWGNRDSMGGLKGELVPTRDIPLAFPNSVDATDDYIYVADMINRRLLRLRKTFAAAEAVAAR